MILTLFSNLICADETEKVFTEIYDNGTWGRNENGEGFSGNGSTVTNAAPYMTFLEDFMRSNNVQSVVDVGFGDWTFSQYINWGNIRYIGIDTVRQVIEKNIARFSSPTITFIHGNATFTDLPSADLMICKDVLQHLPIEDIQLLLKHTHKFKHCLITNDINPYTMTSDNRQILRGDYRTLDLSQPPFNQQGTKVLTYWADNVLKQIFYIVN